MNRIDTSLVIRKVSTLFAGKPSLIMDFNTFLPPEHQITKEQCFGEHAASSSSADTVAAANQVHAPPTPRDVSLHIIRAARMPTSKPARLRLIRFLRSNNPTLLRGRWARPAILRR